MGAEKGGGAVTTRNKKNPLQSNKKLFPNYISMQWMKNIWTRLIGQGYLF